jgi:EmrB/QacA subfamily drug resistance transporter
MNENASAAPETALGSSVALSMLGVNMMVLMATLDMSIVNVSLPTLAVSLGTDFATIQWVILSYVAAIACLLLMVSRLGDMKGKKRIFAAGLVIFTAASLLCGLSPDAYWLIAFRAVQGIGAAMSQALGVAIVTEIAPPGKRGRAIGFVGATVAMGLALGPSLGGILIDLAGWRWIFLVNVPIGLVAMRIVAKYMPDLAPAQTRQRFDVPGAVIAALALGGYCLGMTMGQKTGFDQLATLLLLGGAAFGFGAFIVVEQRTAQPMIDLTLFRNPLFSLNLLMSIVVFLALSSGFLAPFFLQMAQGRSPREMGLMMMVLPVCMGAFAMLSGNLSDRFGPRGLSILGLAVVGAGYLLMAGLTASSPWWEYVLRNAPIGIGIGLFQAPNNSAIMGAVPRDRLGVASGLLNYTRVFGQSTGMPLTGAIFTTAVAGMTTVTSRADFSQVAPDVLVAAFRHTNIIVFFLTLVALGLGVLVWRLDVKGHVSRDA